ncbi:hypothetical protein ACX0G9_13520 [Flavitalea flava]
MKNRSILWVTTCITGICILLIGMSSTDPQPDFAQKAAAGSGRFPDFGAMIPVNQFLKQYPGRKAFMLSQDYPKDLPGEDKIPSFFKIPFDNKSRWKEWLMAARDYCFEGMIQADFVAQDNKQRDWYHMPWLHYGPLASEGFSGLAKEAPISPYQLSPQQKNPGQVYALGFYNDFAGHILYKMWNPSTDPDPMATQAPKGGFPQGTVIFKLLYTELDSTDVPYLKNPYAKLAYITPTFGDSANRIVKTVNLIQMDIMVKDKAADKYGTGWIFGNFCYNGNLNNGKTMKERVKNLVPVGIQFGDDPNYTTNWINPYPVIKTMINDTLKETFINTSGDLPLQHLGWGGRLDGPVDLNTCSCMSCHATGEFPQYAPLVPEEAFIGDTLPNGSMKYLTQTNDPAWKRYFRNLKCGTAYDPALATSTDFSLQVSLALGYYWEWKNNLIGGFYSNQFKGEEHPAIRGGLPFKRVELLKKGGSKLKANTLPETKENF